MNSQEQLEFLTRLGLTTNLARIYLALVKSTPCTAYQIAKSANLASEVVYRSMPKLQKMGLVKKIVTIPAEYQAVPVNMVIDYLLEQKDQENADLKNKSAELLASITIQQKEEPTDDFRIMLVPGCDQSVWFKDELAAVESSLEIAMTSNKFAGWALINNNILGSLLSRGVNLRFVISGVDSEYPLKALNEFPKSSALKVRYISDELPACIEIYDEKEVLITAPVKAEFAQSPVYWSNVPCIVGLCKTYFEAYWKHNLKQRNKFPIKAVITRNPVMPVN